MKEEKNKLIEAFGKKPIGTKVTTRDIRDILGDDVLISENVITRTLSFVGYTRKRWQGAVWVRESENLIRPYSQRIDIDAETLGEFLADRKDKMLSYKKLIAICGFHPSRKSVADSMEELGWIWMERSRVWVR